MKPHYFHPEAAEEYAAAADYYFKIEPALGGRFYDEIERLIAGLGVDPLRQGLMRLTAVINLKQYAEMLPGVAVIR